MKASRLQSPPVGAGAVGTATLVLAGMLGALILAPSSANAVPIAIFGTGDLGSFTGTFDYTPLGDTSGTVSVSLTNTSPPATGGYITAFVFNIPFPGVVTAAPLTSTDADFATIGGPPPPPADDFADSVNGAPVGQFDIGASTGGSFEGGGAPSAGLGVGAFETFDFALTGTGLGSLTPLDFLTTLSVPPGAGEGLESFVVRFRGFDVVEGDDSDKVPADFEVENAIPEPGTALLLSLGLASLAARQLRSRRE
jgi:hypothetical protein